MSDIESGRQKELERCNIIMETTNTDPSSSGYESRQKYESNNKVSIIRSTIGQQQDHTKDFNNNRSKYFDRSNPIMTPFEHKVIDYLQQQKRVIFDKKLRGTSHELNSSDNSQIFSRKNFSHKKDIEEKRS